MTIPVPPEEIPGVGGKYGPAAYVLTTGDDSRVRVTHAMVELSPGQVRCRLGRTASANAISRPDVCVLWAATEDQPMSLIADGVAVLETESDDGNEFTIRIDWAVQHRAAAG